MSKTIEDLCTISVIILTWNSAKYIEKCVHSVYSSVKNKSYSIEVVVVDNGSLDGTPKILERLKSNYHSFKYILLDKNYGTTFPRNLAIRESKGDFILILDSDTEVKENSIDILLSTLNNKNYENVGIVAPRLLYPDGSVQHSCKKLPNIILKILKFMPIAFLSRIGENLELYDPRVYFSDFSEIIDVDYCISACWLVRRSALNEVGLFDEKIFYTPEDVDLCVRMWLKGWRTIYNPEAEVIHHAQRISKRNLKVAILHAKGLFYYFKKYRYCLDRRKLYKKFKN